jgi:hypothetical protein
MACNRDIFTLLYFISIKTIELNGRMIMKVRPSNIIRLIMSRRIRWARHVARIWKKWSVCSILVEKPEGNRLLGTCRRRWEDNIKIDLREMVWCRTAQDRDPWTTLIGRVINFRIS